MITQMIQVKFKKISDDVKMPIKGSNYAACFDVYAHDITSNANNKIIVGLGFKTEIPVGYKGIIVPRSNLTKFDWVLNNSFGVIDADYRGEWKAVFTSLRGTVMDNQFPYGVGERVAQIYFEPVTLVDIVQVHELEESERGEGGFGSTGLK
jgi:dUTP pyrophosphatase